MSARAIWHMLPQRLRWPLARAYELSYWRITGWSDLACDRFYKVDTTYSRTFLGWAPFQSKFSDETISTALPYWWYFRLRSFLNPKPSDRVVDLGSGPGRVLFVFAGSDVQSVRGIELDPEAFSICEASLRTYVHASKVAVELADCATASFRDETIFNFFNPFGADTLRAVLTMIESSLKTNPREIRICFYETSDRALLDALPWLRLEKTLNFITGRRRILIYRSMP